MCIVYYAEYNPHYGFYNLLKSRNSLSRQSLSRLTGFEIDGQGEQLHFTRIFYFTQTNRLDHFASIKIASYLDFLIQERSSVLWSFEHLLRPKVFPSTTITEALSPFITSSSF